jgi:hypothetical protein
MRQHENSVAAAATHDRTKARTDRRLICDYIARMGPEGASDEDLARALPTVNGNALRARRGELQNKLRDDGYIGYGFITDELGVKKKGSSGMMAQCYHVTESGLKALGLDPATEWHAAKPATVAP